MLTFRKEVDAGWIAESVSRRVPAQAGDRMNASGSRVATPSGGLACMSGMSKNALIWVFVGSACRRNSV